MKKYKTFVTEAGRCWPGHKPVPGKKPFTPGSCVKEEVEQIDELSVNKMLKYSDAAEKDRARLNAKWDAGTASRKEQERVIGREEGENRAANKIKKKTGKYPWQLNREEIVVEGSGSKEKQKTPYKNINSPEYRAAAEQQKQQMAKNKAAEPGKELADKIAKKSVVEASYINGVKQDSESKVWKLTSLSHADAVAKHGKENVRHVDAVNRSGDKTGRKHVEVLSKLGEETEQVNEASAAWQRKEGKNPEGGLNRKGIASYRRENPGSKLSMAVTTPPSKLKPGSKAANRRKSFCARMGGMPGPMKKPNGEPTRKALSLKKWNC